MESHQLVNQSSGLVEYYTPEAIIVAAWNTMGGIDLDPASSAEANKTVQAKRFFTEADDGLTQEWSGRIWMNHPFQRHELACPPECKKKRCVTRGYHIDRDIPGNRAWIDKLVGSYQKGCVKQACCLTYAVTSEAWFRPLMGYPQCFLAPRTNFRLPNGEIMMGNSKGSVVTYLGPNLNAFAEEFDQLGAIHVPYQLVRA